jgi:hypothetical protein
MISRFIELLDHSSVTTIFFSFLLESICVHRVLLLFRTVLGCQKLKFQRLCGNLIIPLSLLRGREELTC